MNRHYNTIPTVTLKTILALALFILPPLYCHCISNNQNYIRVTEARTASTAAPLPVGDMHIVTVDYFDGLGRPVQKVLADRSPDAYDIATATYYDARGSVDKEYLPVAMETASGDYSFTNVPTRAQLFYNDARPYTQTIYDDVPEIRAKDTFAPGSDWYDKNHGVNNKYEFSMGNNSENGCRMYVVDDQGRLVNKGLYDEGALRVLRTTDENGNLSLTFTDREERTVLIRRKGSNGEYADTHFVYDNCGKLRYMISPKAAHELVFSGLCDQSVINSLCYSYKYDNRGRLIEKKLPGTDPVYYVYDKLNRVIFTQDGVDRDSIHRQWHVIKYDSKMRIAVEGVAKITGATRQSLQDQYGSGMLIETAEPEKGYDGSLFYSNTAGPTGFTAHKAYFYDDYSHWCGTLPSDAAYPSASNSIAATGMLTGTAVKDFGVGGIIITATKYDAKGNVVMLAEKDFYSDYTSTTFFWNDFRGNPLEKKRVINFCSEGIPYETHTEQWQYTYDNGERLTMVKHKYKDNPWQILTEIRYDPIGRPVKNSYGTDLSALDYRLNKTAYNIRGWVVSQQAPHFTQNIYYNTATNSSKPQYNGNVSAMNIAMNFPGQNGIPVQRSYNAIYNYDNYDRFTESIVFSNDQDLSNRMQENLYYDINGNVTGVVRGSSDQGIQDMVIDYEGNRITNISDYSWGENVDDVPKIPEGDYAEPYGYDGNGNVTHDDSRGIVSVLYNPINLPQRIDFADGNRIWYSHRADGVKTLRRNETRRVTTTIKVNSKGDTIRTERVAYDKQTRQFYGDLVKEDGKSKRIYNEAGYLEFGAAGTAPVYYFHVKDYLGSTRAVIDMNGNQVQGTDYYTGGMPIAPYGSPMGSEERLHTGKEFNAFSGLAWYDNAARGYDPITHRFLQQDPLAEKYPHLSPYASCTNNPLKYSDLDGKDAIVSIDGNNITITANIILTGTYKSQELAQTYQQGINDTWGQVKTVDYQG